MDLGQLVKEFYEYKAYADSRIEELENGLSALADALGYKQSYSSNIKFQKKDK